MITVHDKGVYWRNGVPLFAEDPDPSAREGTMAYRVLRAHDRAVPNSEGMRIVFDSLISHDITYVSILQTAAASGLKTFPIPYVLTNCHNSLCAVGGTINEDDHVFGLSAAKKYGGIYVPKNLAVIHQYARERMAGGGTMILGSDSHTRYGPLGCLGIGEGGPELVKQLVEDTYDIAPPPVRLVYLTGNPSHGVGPHDVAIALCGAVYKSNFALNHILEFCGPGIANLSMDYRFGIDVMTTETACLSSIWVTDDTVKRYLNVRGRAEDYREMEPQEGAFYDGMVEIDLSSIEPMAALPFHPSEAVTIRTLQENAADILRTIEQRAFEQYGQQVTLKLTDKVRDGKLVVDQGQIAGCAGGMLDNMMEAAAILGSRTIGNDYFSLSMHPSSVPVNLELIRSGAQEVLLSSGVIINPCFCGPCFGAGEVPANNALSIRHTTRNFPSREGAKPDEGQLAAVILMDARSIAATAGNQGVLTSASECEYTVPAYQEESFDSSLYERRVFSGWGSPQPNYPLRYGPGIAPWPPFPRLSDHLILELACVIHDEVTTTDELIPSGDTASYRSNPIRLASFALSRRDPAYVGRTERIRAKEAARAQGVVDDDLADAVKRAGFDVDFLKCSQIGSAVFARRPGDGSAREQAASCQRVLGGAANICYEYATKRYRSNCINWGILPFTIEASVSFDYVTGDLVIVPDVRARVANGEKSFPAVVLTDQSAHNITLNISELTDEEKTILLEGCLMNYYAARERG